MDAKRGLAVALGAWVVLACSSDRTVGPGDNEVASVEISPAPLALEVGETRQLAATVKNAAGTVLTGRTVTWSSTAPAVVEVTQGGVASGVAAGSATVRAESEGKVGEMLVTVTPVGGGGPSYAATLSSYLGGSDFEQVRDVAVDAMGNAYYTGGTMSPDFPVTAGALQTVHNPGSPQSGSIDEMDVFITKVDASGQVVWSTFLGGPNYDRAYGVDVDPQGFVYVAGRAGAGFPVTAGAFQTQFQGGQEAAFYGPQDGFVCKIRPDGSEVVWCSYFGSSDPRIVRDLAVDGQGNVYLASGWGSGAYPQAVASRFVNGPAGGRDAVIAKVRTDGTEVLWARYVGGSANEAAQNSVGVDGQGNPYLLTTTSSANAPATAGAYDGTYAGNGDLFIAKLDPQTGALVWGTYLGGSENESTETHEFAVDAAGNAYAAAPTKSPDFPTTPGAFQRTFGGTHDVFVSKISADGSQLVASTFVGGNSADRPEGVAVDGQGRVYFTGTTTSPNFPVTADAPQKQLRGGRDAIVVVLAPDFGELVFSTLYGGNSTDYGRAAAVGPGGAFWFGGETSSSDWPRLNALQSSYGGQGEAVLGRVAPAGN